MFRPRRHVATVLVLLPLASAPAHACSMCRCDDPAVVVPGDDRFVARSWRVAFEAERNSKDQISGEDAGDPLARERETEMRYTLTGSWTVRPHVALLARLPWSQRRIESADGSDSRAGLADPEVLANWSFLSAPGASMPHWVTAQLGLRTPWGQNDLTIRGARADEHLQPGTGAVGGSAGLSAFLRAGQRETVYGSVIGRVNGTNRHGYRYGNALVGSVALQHEAAPRLQGTLELDARLAASDRVSGTVDGNTGGALLYLTPRVQVGLTSRVAVRLGVQLPVARRLYGDQREFANVQTSVVLLP
jgi:hypothetical protein